MKVLGNILSEDLSLHAASWAALFVQCGIVGYLNAMTAGWPWRVRSELLLAADVLVGLGAVFGGVYLTERFFRASRLQVSIKGVLVITGSVATALAFLQYYRVPSVSEEAWLAAARLELLCLAGVLLWLCDIPVSRSMRGSIGTTRVFAIELPMTLALVMLMLELFAIGYLNYRGYNLKTWGWPEPWIFTRHVNHVTTREVLGWNVAYDLLIALLAVCGGTRLVQRWSSLTGARLDVRMVFVCLAMCLAAVSVISNDSELHAELRRLCVGLVWLGIVGNVLTLIDVSEWIWAKSSQ